MEEFYNDSDSESGCYYPEYVDEQDKENYIPSSFTVPINTELNLPNIAEITAFIEQQRPENTTKKTKYDINIWQRFCSSTNERREINEIPANELNLLLCRFFITICKKDGSVYEPSTLTSFQRSIQRQLNISNSTLNIFKDAEFAKSREVLLTRKRQLVEDYAKGNRPQAARALTEEEEELLFDKGLFGNHEPEVLQRTVWWTLSLHFGFRARDESRKLKWGDVELGFDQETGKEVLVWKAERGSKTRHGEGHQRAFYPTAQASNSRRCPVSLYKTFASHRPDSSKFPESPFFLAVNNKRKPDSQVWYTKGPLGKNTIGQFLPKAAKAAGLSGKISNHSVRKTCISRLMDADIPSNFVALLSGHKNLKSLDAYKTASVTHQRQMSRILSCSASDRPTSSSTSSLTETGETLCPNTSDAMSKATGLFSGARIDGCTFNFNFNSNDDSSNTSKQTKKRRISFLDDSDSD